MTTCRRRRCVKCVFVCVISLFACAQQLRRTVPNEVRLARAPITRTRTQSIEEFDDADGTLDGDADAHTGLLAAPHAPMSPQAQLLHQRGKLKEVCCGEVGERVCVTLVCDAQVLQLYDESYKLTESLFVIPIDLKMLWPQVSA
jgi:hypothetical protein